MPELVVDFITSLAMLDRLLHRAAVLQIDGESYRMRAHRARVEHQRRSLRTPMPEDLLRDAGSLVGGGQNREGEVTPPTH